MTKIIAIDIDGIFANFIDAALPILERITGRRYHHDDIDDHKMEVACALTPDENATLKAAIEAPGFCTSIPMYPGALEAVDRLRELGTVHPVTAPVKSATWACERELWLQHHLGFPRDHIISTSSKHLVYADVFVEDMFKTLWAWRGRHPRGTGILMTRTYNRHEVMPSRITRVSTLDEVVDVVRNASSEP